MQPMSAATRRAFLCSLALFIACAGSGGGDTGGEKPGTASPSQTTITLGAVLPTSGPNASVGNEMADSARLAVEQAAAKFSEKGYKLVFRVEDDASDPKQAVAAAYAVTGDPSVFGVVAHLNSGCFQPAISVYQQANTMAISGAATAVSITEGGVRQVARVVPQDGVQGVACADFTKEWLKLQRVAIIHDKTQYGQGVATVFQDRAKALGIEILSFDGINVGEKDFKALLTKIRETKPDLVFFGGLYDEGGFLVKQMRELSMEAVFMGPDGVWGQDFFDVGGVATEGAVVSTPGLPLEQRPTAGAFAAAFATRFGHPVQNYGPYAYDAANVLIESAWKAIQDGKTQDLRTSVVDNARALEHHGALGVTRFDEKGDTTNQQFSFMKVEGMKWQYLATATQGQGIAVMAAPAAPTEPAPSAPPADPAAAPDGAPAAPAPATH
jgi:branched-chain amino acid transport system substrate-binding protein